MRTPLFTAALLTVAKIEKTYDLIKKIVMPVWMCYISVFIHIHAFMYTHTELLLAYYSFIKR